MSMSKSISSINKGSGSLRVSHLDYGIRSFSKDRLGKSNFRLIDPRATGSKKGTKTAFKDVAGLHEAKQEIQEFVHYLKRPEHFTRLGAKLPRGALLLGAPGCGKTLLAKALAHEANVPFLACSGSEFIEMVGGLGAARVRDLFKEGRKRAPCILFIDEIDTIGRQRAENMGASATEGDQTLNQLLVEMDGMDTTAGLIVLAATNRADILDKALLRPGRFDRHIAIDLPTQIERQQILELYLKKVILEEGLNIQKLASTFAKLTVAFSGADLGNLVNESAIMAATQSDTCVALKHLHKALERIVAGSEKRNSTVTPEERRTVAYHEAGHALIGWLLEHTDPLLKVSIIPRTSSALGFAQYSPLDRKLFSKEALVERMCMALGGRAAESLIFQGKVSTGAADDLSKVTKIAYDQIKHYGMSSSLGPLAWPVPEDRRSAGFGRKPYSKHMAHLIDMEASQVVALANQRALQILTDNKEKLEILAQALLASETLSYEQVADLIGPRPFPHSSTTALADPALIMPQPDTV